MGQQATVVFADLFGSTGVYEALGNVRATEAVTQATHWVAQKIQDHQGIVVKLLGDGVLSFFSDNVTAVEAVIDLQRSYQMRLGAMPRNTYMPLRVGVASGEVEMVENDCYGDAVNIAARLSELTGPHQIWVNAAATVGYTQPSAAHLRDLGPIHIRGRSEPCMVYQVEWQEDVSSEFFTVAAGIDSQLPDVVDDVLGGQVELNWLDNRKTYQAFDLPIHIGRIKQADFVVNDPRVSRTHARVEWRNGSVVLVDVSSYGCWVRFSGGGSDLLLRREDCVLHGRGEIALGTPFTDLSAPVVQFSVY